MKVRFISYGYKFYEGEGLTPPEHDFLFSVRDLPNPFWDEALRPFTGLEEVIIKYFENNDLVQARLEKIKDLVADFVNDFVSNQSRTHTDVLTIAFRCTGGKHRSVYFAQTVYQYISKDFAGKINEDTDSILEFEVYHFDMPRYVQK